MPDASASDVGILGGTGALGAALAQRLAASGCSVTIGSRDPERARQRAAELTAGLPDGSAPLTGDGNAGAATADLVIAAVPTDGAADLVGPLASQLAGRVLVSTLSPLDFDGDGPRPGHVEAGSAAALLAAAAPTATVVAGFHTVSARTLGDLSRPLDEDVLLCGDDGPALEQVAELVTDHLDGARPVTVGPLRLAAALESLTAVLIATNRRHRAHAGVRITGLPG